MFQGEKAVQSLAHSARSAKQQKQILSIAQRGSFVYLGYKQTSFILNAILSLCSGFTSDL
jgi:hypothetical protein